jgi:hypothetical protein
LEAHGASAQVRQLISELPQSQTPRPSPTDYTQTGQKTHVSENILVKIKNVAEPVPIIYLRISKPDAASP